MSLNTIDPQTGLKYRTVDLRAYTMLANKTEWGKPKGKDMFTRTHNVQEYVRIQVQE